MKKLRTFGFDKLTDDLFLHFMGMENRTMTSIICSGLFNLAKNTYLSNVLYEDQRQNYHYLAIKKIFTERLLNSLNSPVENILELDHVLMQDGTKLFREDLQKNLTEINESISAIEKILELEASALKEVYKNAN